MWRDGGCLSKRKERQNGVEVSLPACAYIMVTRARQQENGARPARTTSTFVVQKIHSQRHALTISFSEKDKFFFVVITVSVDGKEALAVTNS